METNNKEFKPFDKIIWRIIDFGNDNDRTWHCAFYSYTKENHVFTTENLAFNKNYIEILPYEGNEHLVGTTDEPDEVIELEEGEWIIGFASHDIEANDLSFGNIRKFTHICFEPVIATNSMIVYKYFMRFSDFNPNDMEETKKHILCIKNGKIVKYK